MEDINNIHFFVDITRIDPEKHIVEGYGLRSDTKDSFGTTIDHDSAVACMSEYEKYPAIRQMHQTDNASGKMIGYEADDKGIKITAKIVDDAAWEKVKEEVYRGLSVGAKQAYTERNNKNIGKIKPSDWQDGDILHLASITEFSLVDSPSNKECSLVYRIDSNKELDMEIKVEDVKVDRVEDRKDVNPQAGEKKYGSVKFADAKNKKYPIDSAKHIRAAWSYINMPKNAAKYSSEDVAAIKAKIVAAWKSKIDKEGPPSADVKKADEGDVTRCSCCVPFGCMPDEIDDCMNAIYALQQIKGLLTKEEGETDPEDSEDGKQIEALELAIQAMKDFIESEIQEDNDVDKVAIVDVERVGASISADNKSKAQTIHDHSCDLGAVCKCNKCDMIDGKSPQDNGDPSNKQTNDVINADVSKVSEVSDVVRAAKTLFDTEEITSIDTLIERVQTEVAALNEKIKVLEAIPAAPSTADIVTRIVTKEGTVVGDADETKVERVQDTEFYKNSDPATQAILLTKEARRNQGPQTFRNFPR